MPYLCTAGADIFYEVQGNGPPLIFSHGLGGNIERIRGTLSKLPVRLVLYDNRAHGRTRMQAHSAAPSFSLMAEDMAALLDHLQIEKAIVGGVSMGAGVALALAVRRPALVSRLVLNRPAWLDQPYPPNLEFAPLFADLLERYGVAKAIEKFKQTHYYRYLYAACPEGAVSLLEVVRSSNPKILALAYRSISASSPVQFIEEMKNVKIPALIIGNHNDWIHPIEIAKCWAQAIPEAQFREIPSRFEDAEGHEREFQRVVMEFIEAACHRR